MISKGGRGLLKRRVVTPNVIPSLDLRAWDYRRRRYGRCMCVGDKKVTNETCSLLSKYGTFMYKGRYYSIKTYLGGICRRVPIAADNMNNVKCAKGVVVRKENIYG
jgi:hypothetical protein